MTPSAIEAVPALGGGGGGAVSSVAGRTGAVVLTAADVGAGQLPSGVLLPSGIVIPSSADISGILGTSSSKAAAGNDSRLSDARTPTAHKTSHATGGSDALAAGDLAPAIIAGTAVITTDARLSDARTPSAHATSHKTGGSDAVKLDELAAPTDITTLNASTSLHGLLPKLGGGTSNFLRADGSWAAPPAGSISSVSTIQAADVTMTTSGTYYDGASVSLAAGTWLLMGQAFILAGTTAVRVFTAKLWDGTTAAAISSFAVTGTGSAAQMPLPLSAIVTPGSTTTYKISATSTVNGETLKGTAVSLLGWLVGIKIA